MKQPWTKHPKNTTMKKPRKVKEVSQQKPPKKVYDTSPVFVKCTGEGCSKKDTCVRFTSKAAEKYQPWFTESVSIPDKKKCNFYLENGDE